MTRKYGKKSSASEKVERTMHEWKRGTLKSGSGKKVTSRKQAIAIGLAQTRRAGGKVPSRQLDSEIAEALTKKTRKSAHATRRAAPRPTPYRIKLTPSEIRAVEFARGRYSWPDMLSAHVAEDGSIAFTESEMWSWTDDVDSDAEGGHSPFPLASPAFSEKLQCFYDERV